MNGLTVSNSAFMPTIADTNWDIKGVGDFDGDGKADVILRNESTGQNIGWLMNGLTSRCRPSCRRLPIRTGRSRQLRDVNGDGKADVFRATVTGQDIGWLMNGLAVSMSAFMPTIGDTNWDFVPGPEAGRLPLRGRSRYLVGHGRYDRRTGFDLSVECECVGPAGIVQPGQGAAQLAYAHVPR